MDDVAAREVPLYFEVEEEIISAPSKVTTDTSSSDSRVIRILSRLRSADIDCFLDLASYLCIYHQLVIAICFRDVTCLFPSACFIAGLDDMIVRVLYLLGSVRTGESFKSAHYPCLTIASMCVLHMLLSSYMPCTSFFSILPSSGARAECRTF